MRDRLGKVEASMEHLQAQSGRVDGRQRKQQDASERRFCDIQNVFSKFAVNMYETQADLARVKHCADDLVTRERETAHLLQTLETSHRDIVEKLQSLKEETAQIQAEAFAFKESSSGATVAISTDLQVLAKSHSEMRLAQVNHAAQWKRKLDELREVLDRQSKMDKAQLSQRLDAISDNFFAHEQQSKVTIDAVLKNHSRIREAVDEGMMICSREIKNLSAEVRSAYSDSDEKIEGILQQFVSASIECARKHEENQCSIQAIAHELKVDL